MNLKRIALFGLAAAALSTAASAQTTIRITGSTAFRAATHQAITNVLQPGFTYGYTGATLSGASQAIFIGTTKAPTSASVVIKTAWAGSVGGTKTLTQNLNVTNWLQNPNPAPGTPPPPNTVTVSTTGVANLNGAAGSGNLESALADVSMSDTFQNSTEFRTPVLVDRIVGVIPFQWVRNAGAPIAINNMTPLLAASLLSGGLPLSQFTGDPLDGGTAVYGTGRDEDSGTRLTAFAESAYGIFSSPTQYQIVPNGSVVGNIVIWPVNTVLGTTYPLGHSGYSGGGNLVTAMNLPGSNSNPNNPGWVIGYAGISDAANVVPGTAATATATISAGAVTAVNVTNGGTFMGASTAITFSGGGGSGATAVPVINSAGVITGITVTAGGSGYTSAPTVAIRGGAALAWNGYTYSATAVREGQYTFWGYEHLNYRAGYASASIADQLANQIKNVDAAASGIQLSTMNVGRVVEGGPVTPGNPF